MIKNIQLALILLIPLLGFLFLPTEVISHFDAKGTADATLPRAALILIFTIFSAILTLGPGRVARGLGSSFGERIPRILRCYGSCFGVWTFLFWILVIIANTMGHGKLSVVGTWAISVVLLVPLSLLLIPETRDRMARD